MVLVLSMALEQGLLPPALLSAIGGAGRLHFRTGQLAPVWQPPSLTVRACDGGETDPSSETCVVVLKPEVGSQPKSTAQVRHRARISLSTDRN